MFQTAFGVIIPFPEKMKEAFQLIEHGLRFQVSFEKLGAMLDEFFAQLEEPLFFVLQLPLTQQEEEARYQTCEGPFHDKVCYLDGQTKEQIREILRQYGELLLNDGISQFGVASHGTGDEMFVQKYKLVDIYCHDPQMYFNFLQKYGLKQTDKLLSPWDTFTHETPGNSRAIEINSIQVFDVYDALVKLGMYDAKVIEA